MIRGFVERATTSGGSYTFSSKELRDGVAKELRAKGFHVGRSSSRNVRLHPEYVDDVPDGQTGFGNVDYLTWWTAIYKVDWHEPDTNVYCRRCRVPGEW